MVAPNDLLANAELMSGTSGTLLPLLTQSTGPEAGEDSIGWDTSSWPDGGPFGDTTHTVWYKFVATQSGILSFRSPTDFNTGDTVLMVYTSSSPSAPTMASLSWIASYDDAWWNKPEGDLIVTSGTTYFLQYAPYSNIGSITSDADQAINWTYTARSHHMNIWLPNDDSYAFIADMGPYLPTEWPDVPTALPDGMVEFDFLISIPGIYAEDWAGPWDVNPTLATIYHETNDLDQRWASDDNRLYHGTYIYDSSGTLITGNFGFHGGDVPSEPVPSGCHLYLIAYMAPNYEYPLDPAVTPPTQEPVTLVPAGWIGPISGGGAYALPFTDDFNRDDSSSLDGPWHPVGTTGLGVANNAAQSVPGDWTIQSGSWDVNSVLQVTDAGSSTTFTDSFTRADTSSGGVGNGWLYFGLDYEQGVYTGSAKPGNWLISSNQAILPVYNYAGTLAEAKYKAIGQDVGSNDFDISFVSTGPLYRGFGGNKGFAVRYNSANGSFVFVNASGIYYIANNTEAAIDNTMDVQSLAGDTIRLVGSGSTLTYFVNGTQRWTQTVNYNVNSLATIHGLAAGSPFDSNYMPWGADSVTIKGVNSISGTPPFGGGDAFARYETGADVSLSVDTVHQAATSLYPAAVLTDSPAGYWRLGEDFTGLSTSYAQPLIDSSGSSRNGVWDGGVVNNASLLPVSGLAKYFDPSLFGRATVLYASWMNTSAVTVEALIKTSATGYRNILDRDLDDGVNRVFQWRLNNGLLEFVLVGSSVVTVTGATSVNNGITHHVAATYDGTTIKLYVDGVLDGSASTTVALPSNSSNILIGQHAGGFGVFSGVLEEVAYYTSALSSTRIAAHATARTAVTSANSSVIFAYDPSSDTGYSLDYNGGTTVSLVEHNGSATTLATATVTPFTSATFGINYNSSAGTITVTKGGSTIISVNLITFTAAFSDNFTRANGAIGNGWVVFRAKSTHDGAGAVYSNYDFNVIVSNQIQISIQADTAFGQTIASGAVREYGSRDVDITVDDYHSDGDPYGGVLLRGLVVGGVLESGVYVVDNGAYIVTGPGTISTLATWTASYYGGFSLRVVAFGSSVTVYRGATQIGSFTDTSTGTMHGLVQQAGSTLFDNFVVNYASPKTPLPGTWAGYASDTAVADTWSNFATATPGASYVDFGVSDFVMSVIVGSV